VAKNKTSSSKRGRPYVGRRAVTIRLAPKILEEAKAIAASRGNFSAYIEELLWEKIKESKS
jgi:hypothetical protein